MIQTAYIHALSCITIMPVSIPLLYPFGFLSVFSTPFLGDHLRMSFCIPPFRTSSTSSSNHLPSFQHPMLMNNNVQPSVFAAPHASNGSSVAFSEQKPLFSPPSIHPVPLSTILGNRPAASQVSAQQHQNASPPRYQQGLLPQAAPFQPAGQHQHQHSLSKHSQPFQQQHQPLQLPLPPPQPSQQQHQMHQQNHQHQQSQITTTTLPPLSSTIPPRRSNQLDLVLNSSTSQPVHPANPSPSGASSISFPDSTIAPPDNEHSVSGIILTRYQRAPASISEPIIPNLIDRRSSVKYFDAYCKFNRSMGATESRSRASIDSWRWLTSTIFMLPLPTC